MERPQAHIDILLATYNGERFLEAQLDSLFGQTYTDFRIIVHDDGSTDRTMEILLAYHDRHPNKVLILADEHKGLGATQNFAHLLLHATAPYIAFCDQDDVWLPEKLEWSLGELQRLQNEFPGKPAMVYSDLQVIDEAGNLLADSAWEQLQLDPRFFTLNRLLIQNIPHGCAIMIDRAMQELVCPIPPEAMLHDHWIALSAVLLGAYQAIETPLVLLRNHSSNVTRRQTGKGEKLERYLQNLRSDAAYESMVQLRVAQASALREKYEKRLSETQRRTLDRFILLGSTRGLLRKWIYLRNGFFRTTWRHTLKMVLRG
jgi:glycosyltransferase involved in cell wall biosynthesis